MSLARKAALALLVSALTAAALFGVQGCEGGESPMDTGRKNESEEPEAVEEPGTVEEPAEAGTDRASLTVLFDNYPYREGLKTSWGFSCLVTGFEKTVLFDTGGDASILAGNMDALRIDAGEIDVIVLSHAHGDHVGGIRAVLDRNPAVEVFVPGSFSGAFKAGLRSYGARVVEVEQPCRICDGVYSTGELGRSIKEQSLVLLTDRGSAVITGCAHPGIVDIVARARELYGEDVLLVMGGFHLGGAGNAAVKKVVAAMREMGVGHVGACHCSGDAARAAFASEYGEDCVEVGVGRVVELSGLP